MIKAVFLIASLIFIINTPTSFMSADSSIMEEICNNGIDDDSDGLIDLNDPDCRCNNLLYQPVDLIPNPGFESTADCCQGNLNQDDNCLLNWVIIDPSPDLYHPDCMTLEEKDNFYENRGFNVESSMIGASYTNSQTSSSEAYGICFSSPLKVDHSYNISADIIHSGTSNDYTYFSLYGVKDCSTIAGINSNEPCLDENVTELVISNDIVTSAPFNWTRKTFSFVSDYPYEAFFISLSCSEEMFTSAGAYLYFDNFETQESQQPFALSSSEGNICTGDLVLSSPLLDDYEYQWYNNGVAIAGATSAQYFPTSLGIYQLIATSPDGSICLESYPITIDESYEQVIVYVEETICHGRSTTFKGQQYDEEGIHDVEVVSPSDCDTLYRFYLHTPVTIEGEPILIQINEGENHSFGGNLYTEQGTYYDTLSTSSECDSLAILILIVNPSVEPNLTFSSSYTNESCTIVYFTVCNSGNVAYTEPYLYASLYDDNPVTTNANKSITFDLENVTPIEPGECREFFFFTIALPSMLSDFYVYINDTGDSSTPFDLNTSFPNTPFEEDNYADNSFKFNLEDCQGECTEPDLTVTEIIEDCNFISLKICNIGESIFSEIDLSFSFYNGDPLNQSADLIYTINYSDPFINIIILADQCIDVILPLLEIPNPIGISHIVINDIGTAPTPFDVESDFPTTLYEECVYENNIFAIDFIDCFPEICDNLIDDDGDGLIDTFDPDCECNLGNSTVQTFVSNPDFDEHSECCSSIEKGYSCITGWEAIGGTPDYYNLDCILASDIIQVQEAISSSLDDPMISIGTNSNFSETIGSCLISPLISGEEYSIDLIAGLPSEFLQSFGNPLNLTIYGIPESCPDFSTLTDASGKLCETSVLDQAEEIITISTDQLLNLELTSFSALFTPINNINYIIISIQCNEQNSGTTYFNVAYIQITKMQETGWIFDGVIQLTDACNNPATMSITDRDTLKYQWYIDSLPLLNETTASLSIDPTLYNDETEFYVYVYNDNGCNLVGPYLYAPEIILPTNLTETICNGEEYMVGSSVYKTTGIYETHLESASGCDSLVVLDLEVRNYPAFISSVNICTGLSYEFGGNELSVAGTYRDTIPSLIGCDTILILKLNVYDHSYSTIGREICEGSTFEFGDEILVSEGLYFDTLSNSVGCDSIIELDLRILDDQNNYTFSESICQGDSYPFGNLVLSDSGTYKDTIARSSGCDSIAILELTVIDDSYNVLNESICASEDYDFYGQLISTPGIYFDTLINQRGCDSFIELNLEVSTFLTENIYEYICDGSSFMFFDKVITQPGSYSDTIPSVSSCDSIVHLELELYVSSYFDYSETICEEDTYLFGGVDLSDPGIYYDSLFNNNGCDSIITLNLTILPTIYKTLNATICEGEEYSIGVNTFSETGQYSVTIEGETGCDSTITLDLNVQDLIIGDTIFTTIYKGEFYDFHGMDISDPGFYDIFLTSLSGCDSLGFLDLKVIDNIDDIFVPNIISTTSLIGNNRFIISSASDLLIEEYLIYDRWGNEVFANKAFYLSQGDDQFWDGSFNNKNAAQGVYVYYIKYLSPAGDSKLAYGTVTLI